MSMFSHKCEPGLIQCFNLNVQGRQKQYLDFDHSDSPSLSTKLSKLFGSTIFSWILVSPEHSEDQFR